MRQKSPLIKISTHQKKMGKKNVDVLYYFIPIYRRKFSNPLTLKANTKMTLNRTVQQKKKSLIIFCSDAILGNLYIETACVYTYNQIEQKYLKSLYTQKLNSLAWYALAVFEYQEEKTEPAAGVFVITA